MWVYQELRDRKVALFIDKLPQGVWEIRYTLRAEIPGQYHALPVIGQADVRPGDPLQWRGSKESKSRMRNHRNFLVSHFPLLSCYKML